VQADTLSDHTGQRRRHCIPRRHCLFDFIVVITEGEVQVKKQWVPVVASDGRIVLRRETQTEENLARFLERIEEIVAKKLCHATEQATKDAGSGI
jgi:hypothetical protein